MSVWCDSQIDWRCKRWKTDGTFKGKTNNTEFHFRTSEPCCEATQHYLNMWHSTWPCMGRRTPTHPPPRHARPRSKAQAPRTAPGVPRARFNFPEDHPAQASILRDPWNHPAYQHHEALPRSKVLCNCFVVDKWLFLLFLFDSENQILLWLKVDRTVAKQTFPKVEQRF